jgi:hypothetical protein
VTLERSLQAWKQFRRIVSADEGMQIDLRVRQYENDESGRVEIREPGSNVKVERSAQSWKQSLQMVSIDEGIQIDRSDGQQEKADSPRAEI